MPSSSWSQRDGEITDADVIDWSTPSSQRPNRERPTATGFEVDPLTGRTAADRHTSGDTTRPQWRKVLDGVRAQIEVDVAAQYDRDVTRHQDTPRAS